MATNDLEISIGAVISNLEAGLAQASRQLKQFGEDATKAVDKSPAFEKMGTSVLKLAGSFGLATTALSAIHDVIRAVVGTFQEGIESAGEYEAGLARLRAEIDAQGVSWDSYKAKVDVLIDGMMKFFAIGSEQVVDALSRMTAAGVPAGTALQAVAYAAIIARATSMDFADAAERVQRIMAGQTIAARGLDVNVRALVASHADWQVVLNKIVTDSLPAAVAEMQTSQGKAYLLNAEWQAMVELLGEKLLPVATKFADWLYQLIQILPSVIKLVSDYIGNIRQLEDAVGSLMVALLRGKLADWKQVWLDSKTAMHGYGQELRDVGGIMSSVNQLIEGKLKHLPNVTAEAVKNWLAQLRQMGGPLQGGYQEPAPRQAGATTNYIDKLENERAQGLLTVNQEISKLMEYEDKSKELTAAQRNELDKKILALEQLAAGAVSAGVVTPGPDNVYGRHAPPVSGAKFPSGIIAGYQMAFGDAIQDLMDKMATQRAAGTLTTREEDEYKLEIAQLTQQMAQLIEQVDPSAARLKDLQRATQGVTEAQVALAAYIRAQSTHFIAGLADLLAKAVPGMRANTNGPGSLAFSWQDFLLEAIKNTKAYADIELNVTQIVKVFGEILDSLRPVIDLVLKGLVMLVNVLIDGYNMFARLAALLGIHLQLLDQINMLYADATAPLIQIVHDIPTLNELASGKIAPIHPRSYYEGGTDPAQSGQVQNSFLSKILGTLELILAADLLSRSDILGKVSGWFATLSDKLAELFNTSDSEMRGILQGGAEMVAGIALLSTHTQGALGWLEKLFGVVQLVYGVLTIIQALTAVKTLLLCPEIDQSIERADDEVGTNARFIRAGDLKVGDFLRDPLDAKWNRIHALEILPTTVYRFTTDVETIGVNREHRVMDTTGRWVEVRRLRQGDKIKRYPSGELIVQKVESAGVGNYAAINCERHRYVLGTSVGHNDSADVGAWIMHNVEAAVASAGGFSDAIATGARGLGGFALVAGPTHPSRSVSSSQTEQTVIVLNNYGKIEGYSTIEQMGKDLAQAQRNAKRNRSYMSNRANVGT